MTCVFPSAQIDAATITFSLGNLVNNDTDANEETVLIEFNALVQNVNGNQVGTSLNNTFSTIVNGTTTSTSSPLTVTVVEPSLSVAKTVVAAPPVAGGPITYTVTINNAPGVATAYNLTVNDVLDSNLTLNSVTATSIPTYTSFMNTSAGNVASGSISELRASDSVTLRIVATVNSAVGGSVTIPNTAELTYTSLPGANGTTSNPTGSSNIGTPGDTNGERTGSGGINDYRTNGLVNLPLGSLGNRIWYDANGDGIQDVTEEGIAGVTVRLTWPGPDGNFRYHRR
ncbi:isopeptide-forming domain-containing fimbrial protein [Candidatus Gracilibacteria bacterium]|nr:isopeptide-forming domain-containing fimbrial protein [Candidatus Gracilibacteria bacterium]